MTMRTATYNGCKGGNAVRKHYCLEQDENSDIQYIPKSTIEQ
jgi:hypothetical protein